MVFNIQQQLHGDTIILIPNVKLAFYSTKNERCWEFIVFFFFFVVTKQQSWLCNTYFTIKHTNSSWCPFPSYKAWVTAFGATNLPVYNVLCMYIYAVIITLSSSNSNCLFWSWVCKLSEIIIIKTYVLYPFFPKILLWNDVHCLYFLCYVLQEWPIKVLQWKGPMSHKVQPLMMFKMTFVLEAAQHYIQITGLDKSCQ